MNHETTIATLNAQLNNCAKDLYEKDKRIAELERENARLDAALDGEISCRDHYHEWADKLAAEISRYFGVDIGEHSNANNPWEQAYEAVPAAPAVEQETEESLREGITILDDMIDSIRRHGNYTKESTLNFLNQLRQCIAPPSVLPPLPDDAPAWAHRIRERDSKASTAPQAADTDKVREVLDKLHAEIMNLPANKSLHIYEDDIGQTLAYKTGHRDARHAAAELAASMAAQAPVREVPEVNPRIINSTSLVDIRGDLAVAAALGESIIFSPESMKAILHAMRTGTPLPAAPAQTEPKP